MRNTSKKARTMCNTRAITLPKKDRYVINIRNYYPQKHQK